MIEKRNRGTRLAVLLALNSVYLTPMIAFRWDRRGSVNYGQTLTCIVVSAA